MEEQRQCRYCGLTKGISFFEKGSRAGLFRSNCLRCRTHRGYDSVERRAKGLPRKISRPAHLKKCLSCLEIKGVESFYLVKNKYPASFCIPCSLQRTKTYNIIHRARMNSFSAARCAKRRAIKLKATPPWADIKAIRDFYKARKPGQQIDHIVPLNGEDITGLHVPQNLQYLPIKENIKKSNRFDTPQVGYLNGDKLYDPSKPETHARTLIAKESDDFSHNFLKGVTSNE